VLVDIIWATSTVLIVLIFARAILSWFIRDPYNPLMEFLITVTEPILGPIRSIMPRGMMIDFSPWIAAILIQVVAQILIKQLS
jgi:YggT family protein